MRFNKSIIQIKNDEARPALAVAAYCLSTCDLPPVIPRVAQATDRAIIRNSPFIEHIANEKPSYPAFHFWMNINPNFRFVAIPWALRSCKSGHLSWSDSRPPAGEGKIVWGLFIVSSLSAPTSSWDTVRNIHFTQRGQCNLGDGELSDWSINWPPRGCTMSVISDEYLKTRTVNSWRCSPLPRIFHSCETLLLHDNLA